MWHCDSCDYEELALAGQQERSCWLCGKPMHRGANGIGYAMHWHPSEAVLYV